MNHQPHLRARSLEPAPAQAAQAARATPPVTPVAPVGGSPREGLLDHVLRWALSASLRPVIRQGALTVRLPGGQRVAFGDGCGPRVEVALGDRAWALRMLMSPALAVGEAYTAGALTIEHGTLAQFTNLLGRNAQTKAPPTGPWRWLRDRVTQANARRASRRNIAHHYDLTVDFYRLFLDEDLQYSCAYFASPDLDLAEAQRAKKRHLAAKLLLAPGQRVLDIGCGWGGLALSLAEDHQVWVHGVTLSVEQCAAARARAQARALTAQARFSLIDYRDLRGAYDRIVSVGMFEHVGRPNFESFFKTVARRLREDGVAVIHTIGRPEGAGFTQPWIAKHIFPGGYIPALSEITAAAERAGLLITDVEVLRLHYAQTLRCWRERFAQHRSAAAALYGEPFCRMWDFYLCLSETAFRERGHSVFQVQLTRRIDVVPLTRDYIAEAEAASGPLERTSPGPSSPPRAPSARRRSARTSLADRRPESIGDDPGAF